MRPPFVGFSMPAFCLFMTAASAAGELPVVGTGDGIELLRAVSAVYTADHPETVVLVPPSIGSGGGIAAVGSDKEVLARIARPLSDSEKGLGLVEEPVFHMPAVFYTHPGVGVRNLTHEQLAAIYAGEITNWYEVGGADMRIKVVRREEADSTLAVLRQSMPSWAELPITTRSKTALTTQESYDTVREVEGAIGFGPYTTLLDREFTVLMIDGLAPTDKEYPSAVVVAFAYKPANVTEEARDFIKFVKGDKAQKLLISMGGVPAQE